MTTAESVLGITRARESSAVNTFRMTADPPVFLRGDGPWLYDDRNRKWLDLVCGSGTSNLGHNHPAHLKALNEALATGILHTGTRLPSPFRARLYEELISILPAELGCIQFANSGAEANETAIKVAQYATGRTRLIAFEGGYHGRTLGALSLTDGARIRKPFSLLHEIVDFLPFPGSPGNDGNRVDTCLAHLADRLDGLQKVNDLPAALFVEAIQGVNGVRVPPDGFLSGVRDLTLRHKVLMVCDEIWCGFGRAGRWFSFERTGIVPDMVTLGKAMTGGLPLSAVAASPAILKAWPPGIHTSTFQGNPLACNMAAATIRTIRSDRLLSHVERTIEPVLERFLRPLDALDCVGDVRIAGAQAAVEFVDEFGRPNPDSALAVAKAAQARRILVYLGGGEGNSLMVVPPINIEGAHLSKGLAEIVTLVKENCGNGE
ncbi:MAG: aspartate aminotransferase family protein [Paracoccaceae bacterium]|nr:aspartate aminotransferase family protein [Paracoccaceae bacterium]MDE2915072.1 aspartate aminotransferase family protein [Paracoccaceae bacterium]